MTGVGGRGAENGNPAASKWQRPAATGATRGIDWPEVDAGATAVSGITWPNRATGSRDPMAMARPGCQNRVSGWPAQALRQRTGTGAGPSARRIKHGRGVYDSMTESRSRDSVIEGERVKTATLSFKTLVSMGSA